MAEGKGFDDARAFWDERFAAPEYIFGREPNRFLVSQAALFQPGAAVLDLATGEGRNAVWLAQRGCRVTGIDISPKAIEKARRLGAESGVEVRFEVEDVRQRSWVADAFDAVVTIFIQFAAPAERRSVFEGMQRTLRPGGVIVLQGYTPKQLEYKTGGPPHAEQLYTRELLQASFGDLKSLDIKEYDAVIQEGSGHNGMSALIDLVGTK